MTRLGRAAAWAPLWLGLSALPLAAQGPATRALTPVAADPAAASSDAPILRIDADFHTQVVNKFAQDRGGRIVVTGSDDKTVRIWDAHDGAALATLRVPMAPGDEGAIYAVAISPDDKTLIVGGNTGYAWDKSFALYIFDLAGQRLRGRLPELPGPINDIAFAPDGRSFAVAMGNRGGVRLIDAANGSLIASDFSFRQRVTAVAFDRRGRLYATGYDNEVRLYDPAGRRLGSRALAAGALPYAIAVSPDGTTVAIGYRDQARVDLLNAQDLSLRTSLTTGPSGGTAGGLGAVAFGADGSLFAAGSLRGRDGRTVVRRWAAGSRTATEWSGLRDTVLKLGATEDGGVLVVGADPAMVRLDRTGRVVFRKDSPGLDFRDVNDRLFNVSYDGLSVRLQSKTMTAPWVFDLGQRRIGPPEATRALVPVPAAPEPPVPVATGRRPEVSNWRNTSEPRIEGRAVELAAEELSRSYAVDPAGRMVVLGTDYRVRVYRRDGTELDTATLPGAVWGVGVSGDGGTVVAAVSDGTLRWFGLSATGRLTPRVALFVNADARRWVSWTEAGFFDSSDVGGEGMVGLQLNHGSKTTPEWLSFAQVYRRFYAPDTVAARLRGQQVADPAAGLDGIRQAMAKSPPPTIELSALCWTGASGRECQKLALSNTSRSLATRAASGADATVPAEADTITLQYLLRGPQAASSVVDLFVNSRNGGRALRDVTVDKSEAPVEQTTALDPGLNRIQLRAYDGDQQTYAETRMLQINRSAPAAPLQGKPNLYVLAVGINEYGREINHLDFAVPDARSVAQAIKARVPETYGAIELTELYDVKASTDGVLRALAAIAMKAGSRDTVLIYLSGHGATIDQRYYFITQNVPNVEKVTTTALSEGALVNALAGIKSNRTMLFLDTCHAGAFSLDAASKLAHETGRYILAAAASVEEALDSYDGRNGVFATAVLRGLGGQAGQGKSEVNNFDLGLFVQPLVRVLATERRHNQSARFKIDADDAQPFPIVAVRGAGAAN